MAIKDLLYKSNQTIISLIGTDKEKQIRVVTLRCLRTSGIENEEGFTPEKRSVNDDKLAQSLSRTKRTIFELAACNEWKYFGTFTLDPEKYNRTDLNRYRTDLAQWIRYTNRKYGCSIKYLFIPELHKDNSSWHIHGLMHGIPEHLLKRFSIGDVMGKKLSDKVLRGDEVFNWEAYEKKFGYCSLEPLRSLEAASKYVTKYITKDLFRSVTELNAHMYFASQGLKRAERIKKGTLLNEIEYDYENDFYSVRTLKYSDETLKMLTDNMTEDYN